MNADNQKLADIMLGEALLELIHRGGPVSARDLITTLQGFAAACEQDLARWQACQCAIVEVRNTLAAIRKSHPPQPGDSDSRSAHVTRDGSSHPLNKH